MSLYLGDIPIANDGLQRLTGEIGDIGIAPFGIDESLNLRRYLNGQIISQTQFEAFTNKVKSAIALYPNLAATEENWQAEVTASVLGQCGKFVVDDEAGTIRLPKVVNINGLQDLALIGGIKAESLPNIKGDASLGAAGQNSLIVGHWSGSGFFSTRETTDGPVVSSGGTTTGATHRILTADASRSSTAYQDGAPVQQEAIQYPYYIQVATGIEETLPVIREYGINTPFFFGQSMYSENAPYNASWLASNGQYNAQSLYPDLWVQLTGVELNSSLNVGDTIEISGKTYVKRGLPVVLSTDTVTDYDFVVDQDNSQFRLPLLNGEEDLPGNRVENLTLQASGSTYTAPANGAYYFSKLSNATGQYVQFVTTENSQLGRASGLENVQQTFEVSKGEVVTINYTLAGETGAFRFVYAKGNGTLYYYVGDVVQDASLINAGAVLSDVVDLKQTTLRTDQITNCITEIPQRIKYTLVDGTLTIKAGSFVFVPYGTEDLTSQYPVGSTFIRDWFKVYDTQFTNGKFFVCVELAEDKNLPITASSAAYTKAPVFFNFSANPEHSVFGWANEHASGTETGTVASTLYYQIDNNTILWQNTGTEYMSLPILQINHTANSGIVTIDQVFNGFGYIGSTVFALPGVKGLIPNGRNADGSLRSIEARTDSVITYTNTNPNNKWYSFVSPVNGIWTEINYKTDGSLSVGTQSINWFFDENANYWMYNGNKSYNWIDFAHSANNTTSPFAITSFTPKLPFQAVDRNDSSWISAQAMPSGRYIDLTLGASGSTYTAPANGWFVIQCEVTGNNKYFLTRCAGSDFGFAIPVYTGGGSIPVRTTTPCLKGGTYIVSYNVTVNATSRFRFIYAEGEN